MFGGFLSYDISGGGISPERFRPGDYVPDKIMSAH